MYSSFCKRGWQYDPFRAKEIINRRILQQQTSQMYMYSSFFKRERQHDPFRAKEIINRGILQQQTSQIYMFIIWTPVKYQVSFPAKTSFLHTCCLVPSRALADFGTRETSTSEARKGSWEGSSRERGVSVFGLSLPMMHCDKAWSFPWCIVPGLGRFVVFWQTETPGDEAVTREDNIILSSHVKRSPSLWLHNNRAFFTGVYLVFIYMPACGYEFYLLVFDSISHSFAALTREISSWALEDKIHIHARSCNILYIARSLSVSDNMTCLERKKLWIDEYCYNKLARYTLKSASPNTR